MRRHRYTLSVLLGFAVLASGVVAVGSRTSQAEATISCHDVLLYWARGVTQSPDATEARTFFKSITDRLDTSQMTVDPVEAGGDADLTGYKGNRYTALDGLGGSVKGGKFDLALAYTLVNDFGDETTGAYWESLNKGVAEILPYLNDRAIACPNEQWILGGYSMGANTLGNVLNNSALSSAAKQHIAFIELFGDPKLQLNGRGTLLTAPGCRGAQYQWVRGNVHCYADGGVLVARNPYIPADLQDRIGSWCDKQDGICSGNELTASAGNWLSGAHGECN